MLASNKFTETEPRLSLSGVVIGVVAAAVVLFIAAPGVSPLVIPRDGEALIGFTTWWVAAGLSGWLALSLGLWLVLLGRPPSPSLGWVRFVTLPGSRKLAEAMLAISVLAGTAAACSPGVAEVQAPRIEVLSSGDVPATSFDSAATVPLGAPPASSVEAVPGELLSDTTIAPPAPRASAPLGTAAPAVAAETAPSINVGVGTLADAQPGTLLADTTVEPSVPSSTSLDVEAGSSLAPGTGVVPQEELPASEPHGAEVSESAGVDEGAVISDNAIVAGGVSALAGEHTVVAGENLWLIAEAHLGMASDSQPDNSTIANYWSRLIEANRAAIRSGNPDLIFPGESLILPFVGE